MKLLSSLRRLRKHHAAAHAALVFALALLTALPPGLAADVLRPGGAGGSGGAPPVVAPGVDPVATAQALAVGRANAGDVLARAAHASQAVQAMQAAARALAISGPNNLGINPNNPTQLLPDVPNGLGVGGLQVDPAAATNAALWSGANAPTQATAAGHTTVTVEQTAQQALLNWRTFNIGKETTLKFDQSAGGANAGQWIAFNFVNDPSAAPTQILGSIQAQGQVYVINQNGIIFGGSSQVNTHTLVASSLPINSNLVSQGLLNNPDAQFLFSALALPAGSKGPTDGFTPPPRPAGGRIGDVTVQAGAIIEAPTTDANVGGRVVLVGPNVTNHGTISTPDGQTILAAGLQVGFVAHSSSDPSLRGLDVYVGAVVDPASLIPAAGTAVNSGEIKAPRGNVTIAGKEVVHTGAINSSTSVALNGRVDLLASYDAVTNTAYDTVLFPNNPAFLQRKTGHVELGAGSVIQILPEWTSTEKVFGTELALRSQINIQGLTVHLGVQSTVLAPNAFVNINAGVWEYVPGIPPQTFFVRSGGQIYLDSGAVINVAGSTDINVPVTQNLITLQLRAAELADSPLQRNGILRGRTITVDIRETGTYNGKTWVGTPLADISGYVGLIERGVGELTIAGGTVNLNAGGSVVVQSGAEINTSAGWINFTGGVVETTKLITGGRVIDISDATPNLVYDGIYSAATTLGNLAWNVSTTFYNFNTPASAYYDPGHVHGGAGGKLNIATASAALDGRFLGLSVIGPDQRVATPGLSEFTLRFEAEELINNEQSPTSPTPPTVIFQSGVSQPAAAPFTRNASGQPAALDAARLAEVYLSPDLLTTSSFGKLHVENADGRIIVPADVTLTTALRGGITLIGANLDVFGSLNTSGGEIVLKALNISPTQAAAIQRDPDPTEPPPNAGRGLLTLGASAKLNAAGTLVDDRTNAVTQLPPSYVNDGGSIHLEAYSVSLATGSVLNVSGGVRMTAAGVAEFGSGGEIVIKAGQDPTLGYVVGGSFSHLGSELLGYSGAAGGTLSIQAPLVQVSGTRLSPDTLLLQPSFFTQGGFSNYKIAGLGVATGVSGQFLPGVYLAPGAVITPVADSLALVPGSTLSTRIIRNPEGLRSLSSIEFVATGVEGLGGLKIRGSVVLDEGAVIRTDPRASVVLEGNTVAVLGRIEAPGGKVEIRGGRSTFDVFGDVTQALSTVYIGPRAVVSAAGTLVLVPDDYGRRIGEVLAGGEIAVSGNIVAAAGAVLDVSGTSGILDLHPTQISALANYVPPAGSGLTAELYSLTTIATRVDSNGGQISLSGGQFLAVDATLRGNAGGVTALGGSLQVESGRYYPVGTVTFPVTDTNLVVKQSGATIGTLFPEDASAIGRPLLDAGGAPLIGRGYFAVDSFTQSGMDSLTLKGAVEFAGATTITARGHLSVASSGILSANGLVTLNAAAISLGRAFVPPVRPEDRAAQLPFTNVPPLAGSGSLVVNAGHVEAGTLALQNISNATLTASNGDIVGNGILTIAGHLTLSASQIYAPTATQFTAVAYGAGSSITTLFSGSVRQLPLSAGSTLSLYAETINHQGVLRAPIGTINLGWDGTGTAPRELLTGSTLAFPVTTHLTLGATSVTSVSAIDPISGLGVVIPYGVSFDGTSWIDPSGVDITAGGLPEKIINLAGVNIEMSSGASVDLRGGGDLQAYRWIQGNGGTRDILDTEGSFAIIPGYLSNAIPYAYFNTNDVATNLIYDAGTGYVNSTLHVGDRIFLAGSNNLAAGVCTLLPARYALLPGAVLVTPKSTDTAIGTREVAGNISLVSGYRFNDLNATRTVPTLASRFEVVGQGVINARSDYSLLSANTFLKESALRLNATLPQLPQDSGYLLFQGTQSMSLLGNVLSTPLTAAGRGASIDISAPLNIAITNASGVATPGTISLNAAALSAFGAESLIIGGKRTRDSSGVTITVQSTNITVDNAGTPLTAKDVTLATKGAVTLAANAAITTTGTLAAAAESFNVSGNGALVRVSQGENAGIVRTGTTTAAGPSVNLGAGVQISGTRVTLDSTAATLLDPSAVINASHYAVNSGRISILLGNPGTLQASPGLVVTSALLSSLQNASSLSLLSYSSIDVYGVGSVGGASLASLTLSAGEIRGFNQAGGTALFHARDILLHNQANVAGPGAVAAATGQLTFDAATLRLGVNQVAVDQFTVVNLLGTQRVIGEGVGGITVQGALNVQTPLLTGAAGAVRSISSSGNLSLLSSSGTAGAVGGLGSSLALLGANVSVNTQVRLPSGALSIRSTAGNLTIGSLLDVGGVAQVFYDATKYTDAGEILLRSDVGNVVVASQGTINVSAHSGGGNAGRLTVSAVNGAFTHGGTLLAQGGSGGKNGSFELDTLALSSLSALNGALSAAAFNLSQTIRVRTGNVTVDGVARAATFDLTADLGSITVTGTINASGTTGGTIHLASNGNLTLANGSVLTVAGQTFSNAGKGGQITLESGTERNGIAGTGRVDIQTGSRLDLSVAALVAGEETVVGSSASQGQFSGKLHIRAPQNSSFNDLLVNPVNGTIIGASSILVEGYRIYDLTASGGLITTAIQTSIRTDAQSYMGTAGTTVANYTNMMNRLLANNAGLTSVFVLAPGAEIINRTGNLTLGATNSNTTADWNLVTSTAATNFRFGPKSAPGVLTLRAAGNITFYNALSDSFTPTLANTNAEWLWTARSTTQNLLLPANTQSWDYRITAGADLSAAGFRAVVPTVSKSGSGSGTLLTLSDTTGIIVGQAVTGQNIAAGTVVSAINGSQVTLSLSVSAAVPAGTQLSFGGSVSVGKTGGAMTSTAGDAARTATIIGSTVGGGTGLFQVIRTGSGNIDISASRSVQLNNQFASIYTAGTRVSNASLGGTFSSPVLNQDDGVGSLGAAQQNYPALYSLAGGNVNINAGINIERLGAAMSRELPNNWLYRRGYVDSATGQFGVTGFGDPIGSTAWWVDFSNFFEGVGALGGGNVTITAGQSIVNVDAVIPTNGRMSAGTAANPLAVNQTLVELGGGDLVVRAGANIDAGVYYVERGRGTLHAGGQITTNSTRSPGALNTSTGLNAVLNSNTWLPTTLFVGKGGFDVSARGNVLLGPVANVFLMPQGVNNSFWNKTYFSTYASDSFVNVSSLGGTLTLRQSAVIPGSSNVRPLLEVWASTQQLKTPGSAAVSQPWLRLAETNVVPFNTILALMPPVLRATAFSGDINLAGNFTLAPSATGTIELLARGALNGMQPLGTFDLTPGNTVTAWAAATINVSDANPAAVPGVRNPLAYQNLVGTSAGTASATQLRFLESIDKLFRETGATAGSQAVLSARQALHSPRLLHLGDTSPVRIYAAGGDIAGLLLYSPKAAHILAARDISDVALYLQNVSSSDISIVSSGRDILPYNAGSLLRLAANRAGNIPVQSLTGLGSGPLAGDIQISGPGVLQVLAGRNLDLGSGASKADGTAAGLTSIGNGRNPYLPFGGADIIAGAGLGLASGLSSGSLNFTAFINQFVLGPDGAAYLAEVSPNPASPLTAASFALLSDEEKKQLALEIFYLVLRDAGRGYNDPDSPGYRKYDTGYAAIAALFPGEAWNGSINTQSREVRTKNGGSISLFAPGGGLTLASSIIGSPLTPPGIITDSGGDIAIFTKNSVSLGISRIFTLKGGNEIIWSSTGDIAAGSSSKTVQSAPPTRVIIDPQSADLATDLAGLATGGGIGVLASVKGVAPGSVDLIAPLGVVDAGDAGIRASGNLNIAATQVLNAGNISVGGTATGAPVASVSAPNMGAVASAATAGAATASAAAAAQQAEPPKPKTQQQIPSVITVEVLGYGGSDDDDDEEKAGAE